MDIKDGNDSAGANVICWEHHGGKNQQWWQDGDKIKSSLNGMALDIRGGSKEASTEIILWPAKEGSETNQSWKIDFNQY